MSDAPMDTSSMIATMLGIGPIMSTLQSPQFHADLQGFMRAALEIRDRCARIEASCARIEARLEDIAYHVGFANGDTAVPAGDGTVGAGAHTVAARLGHNGIGEPARARGGIGDGGE